MSPYTSELRQKQAEATRRDIVRAARKLFARKGYAHTSMADIAQAAGVAVQTIYASCGSKRDLVLALLDEIDVEAGVPELSERAARSERPEEILALGVHLTRRLNEQCGDIIAALLSAAAVEPDAAAAAAEGKRRHREGARKVAKRLAAQGALRDGVSADEAAALLSTLTWQPIYAQLRGEHRWSLDDCERWIADTLSRALLR